MRLPYENARQFIINLPDDLPLPECSIEPDGAISLDWLPARHRTFTLSVDSTGRFPYAWVDGSDRGHAVARLHDGQIPDRILNEIRRFLLPPAAPTSSK